MRKRSVAWIVSLSALLLYLCTLSRHYSADSILYALAIESGEPMALVDPYHLLLHPLGWAFWQTWRLLGWREGALYPLQVLNAIGGAACVGLMYAIGRAVSGSPKSALLASAGFAVSGATWLLSTDAEFVTIPLAAALLVLWGLLAAPPERAKRPSYALLLGLGTALAFLAYLTGAFLLPLVAISLFARPGLSLWERRKAGILYVATFAGMAAFTCLVLAIWHLDPQRLRALLTGGSAYGQWSWLSIPHGAYAFLRTLALYPNLAMNDSTQAFLTRATAIQRALFLAYYTLVLLAAAAPLALAIREYRRLWSEHRHTLLILACWTALYAGFGIYWVPGDISFWIPVLAAWWLFLSLGLAVLQDRQGRAMALSAVGIALLFAANGGLLILPHHDRSRNHRYQIAVSTGMHATPGDLLIVSEEDPLALHILYFARRRVLLMMPYLRAGKADELVQEMEATWRSGGRVFLISIGSALDCANALARASPLARLRTEIAWRVDGQTVYEMLPAK